MHSRAPAPPRLDGGARNVVDAIRRITRALRDFSMLTERSVGLSGAQIFALRTIARDEPLSVNELAARTLTHQSSVSVVARKLVERGLCAKRASAEDARRHELAATRAGKALLKKAPEPIQDRLIDAIHEMPAADRQDLGRLLGDLVRRMAADGDEPPMFFESGPEAPRARAKANRVASSKRGSK
jgi:DNA-binding MarR family transcriptional regulator